MSLLSLVGWQAVLAINLGWTAHGIRIGQPPQIVASAFSLVATLPILYLLARELGRRTLPTLLPGLGLAAVMIGVDQFLGSAAYGIFAIVPRVIAMAGQSVELVRAPHVKGVSTASLLIGTLNQTLWAIWAVLLQDSGSMIAILARYGTGPLLERKGPGVFRRSISCSQTSSRSPRRRSSYPRGASWCRR